MIVNLILKCISFKQQQTLTTEALQSPRLPTSMPAIESVHQQHQHQTVQQQPNITQNLMQHGHQPHSSNSQQNVPIANQQQQHHSNQTILPKISNSASTTTSMPPPTQLSPQQQFNAIAKKAQL